LQYECAGSVLPPRANTYCGCLDLGTPVLLQRTVPAGGATTGGDSAVVCLVGARLGRDLGVGEG
jgi:hypothetical protein